MRTSSAARRFVMLPPLAAAFIVSLSALAAAQEPVKSFDQLNTRVKVGDTLWVTDGQGREVKAASSSCRRVGHAEQRRPDDAAGRECAPRAAEEGIEAPRLPDRSAQELPAPRLLGGCRDGEEALGGYFSLPSRGVGTLIGATCLALETYTAHPARRQRALLGRAVITPRHKGVALSYSF